MSYITNEKDINNFATAIGAVTHKNGDEIGFKYCPYCHGGKNKDKNTFSINSLSGAFNCLRNSCGKHGHFVQLARDFNFDLGTANNVKKYRNLSQEQFTTTEDAIKYMESRGISQTVTKRYRITTKKDDNNILVFPFYDENNILVSKKYRRTDFYKKIHQNKEWFEKDTKAVLFGMSQCEDFTTLVITEGQIDCLSLAECGIKNAVSVPNGALAFTWLDNCKDWISKFKEIIVFGDFENGKITVVDKLREKLRMKIRQVRTVDYLGEKDANDILRKYGKDAILQAIHNAYIPPLKNFMCLSDVEDIDINNLPKILTGIYDLDKLIGGLIMGQIILLSGKRGEGKSTFMSQLVFEALKQEQRVLIYSGELTASHFKVWLDLQVAGADNIITTKNEYGDKEYSLAEETIEKINKWYRDKAFIFDNSHAGNEETGGLIKTIENAITYYDIKLVCIDNLMTVLHINKNEDLYRAQSEFVRELKQIAMKYNVAILLIAHPKKSNNPEFNNDDVSGSSDITNFVDVIMAYERNQDINYKFDALLSVTKNRLTGHLTNANKIPLFYSESSKRITGVIRTACEIDNETFSQ